VVAGVVEEIEAGESGLTGARLAGGRGRNQDRGGCHRRDRRPRGVGRGQPRRPHGRLAAGAAINLDLVTEDASQAVSARRRRLKRAEPAPVTGQ